MMVDMHDQKLAVQALSHTLVASSARTGAQVSMSAALHRRCTSPSLYATHEIPIVAVKAAAEEGLLDVLPGLQAGTR
jgi:hypothetical protein